MNDQNLLRTAKVSSVDYENGMISVVYNDKGQSVSAKMPMMNFNDEYYMPKVGSQVQVALLSNGSSRGVVLGNTWEQGNKPASTGKGVYRKDYSKTSGACTVEYDDDSGVYKLTSGALSFIALQLLKLAGATIEIDASGKIVIDTDQFEMTAEEATADIKKLELTGEEITVDTKQFGITAEEDVSVETTAAVTCKAGTDLNVEDATYKTTLSKILARLEALDGDTSARK